MTVTGRVDADELGPTLPHEHVSIDRHLELVQNMRQHGLLDRVLLSHDAGWYSVGEPDGGKFRPYTTLFQQFLPALKKADFSDEEIQLLTVKNPAQAFAIHVRSR